MITENPTVIPLTNGTPSKYWIKSVLANKVYFAQSYRDAIREVIVPPINKRKMDNPTAIELFLNTAEIINAIVVIMITSMDDNK